RLDDLAQQHGFKYSSCTVRHAKTRWGSCSVKGSINLNAGLVLMPLHLLDYVVLHELCHTRQLNHSSLFWAEMYLVDAKFRQHRHELHGFKLPSWWHVS
ncbi:M48 family metallopeptidase, partial [Rhizobium hidalgonense]